MDNKRIFIVNLSKGKIGEDKANLLGSLLVSSIQVEAMSRAFLNEEDRTDFFFYIDEFQNFGTDKFISILSEARKYRLSLTIAHQYLNQINPKIKNAILGNVGNIVLFSLASDDALEFKNEFIKFPTEKITALPLGTVMVKQFQDGRNCEPEIVDFQPIQFKSINKNRHIKIINYSKIRYGRNRQSVEEKINRFYGIKA